MPKKTFYNLDDSKRKEFTNAFLREFAVKTFDEASITEVVKTLGIAKGSVYQYFDDKLELFMHLLGECMWVKSGYTESVKRESYPDFWDYFRALFVKGLRFDIENPLHSHFLHNLTQNLNSPSIKGLYEDLLAQIVSGFEKMVAHEVELGLFRDDIPTKTMGFLLYKIGVSIQEQMEVTGEINPRESIKTNQPVYKGKRLVLLNTVDDYIKMAKPAFNRKS